MMTTCMIYLCAPSHDHTDLRPRPPPFIQDMENPAQRAYLEVPEHRSGVLVVKLDPLSAAAGVLRENDVVMEVGSAVCNY